jgi:uncharacterized membrane protein
MSQAAKRRQLPPADEQTLSPFEQLQASLQDLASAVAGRAVSTLSDRLNGATERLTGYVQSGGEGSLFGAVTGIDRLASGKPPIRTALAAGVASVGGRVKETVKGAAGSLRSGKGKDTVKTPKVTNIVEQIDVGVPVDVAYQTWTQSTEFQKFMNNFEQLEKVSDEKLAGKTQASHRSWDSTIVDQVPNERIVWRSEGDNGYVDGAVTFHELATDLTRVIVVLEYHRQGVFERTSNLWQAPGRRARLGLKNFQRQVMTETVLHADEGRGWHGEFGEDQVVDDAKEGRSEGAQERRTRAKKAASVPKPRQAPNRAGAVRRRAQMKEMQTKEGNPG